MKHAQGAKGPCPGRQTTETACVYSLSQSRSLPLRNPTGSLFITSFPSQCFLSALGRHHDTPGAQAGQFRVVVIVPLPHVLQLSSGRPEDSFCRLSSNLYFPAYSYHHQSSAGLYHHQPHLSSSGPHSSQPPVVSGSASCSTVVFTI